MLNISKQSIHTEVLGPEQIDEVSTAKKLAAAKLLQATPEYGRFKPEEGDNPAGIMNNWEGHFLDSRSPSATWVLVYDNDNLIGCLRYLTAQTEREDLQPLEVLEYKRFRDLNTNISHEPTKYIEVNRCAFSEKARGQKLAYYLVRALLESVLKYNLSIFTASRSPNIVGLIQILMGSQNHLPNCQFVYEKKTESIVQASSNDLLKLVPLSSPATTLRDALAYHLPIQELPSDINTVEKFSEALNRSIYVIHEDGHSVHINEKLPGEPVFIFSFTDGTYGAVTKCKPEEALTKNTLEHFPKSLTCGVYIFTHEQQKAALEKTHQRISALETSNKTQKPTAASMFPDRDPTKAKLESGKSHPPRPAYKPGKK